MRDLKLSVDEGLSAAYAYKHSSNAYSTISLPRISFMSSEGGTGKPRGVIGGRGFPANQLVRGRRQRPVV